jgi:hypothetical protein
MSAKSVLHLLTGEFTPSAEEGTAFFAAPSSYFSFCINEYLNFFISLSFAIISDTIMG